MRVQLRRRVAVHRTATVVLEPGRHPCARRLSRCIAADPRLRVFLHLIERYLHALLVRLFYPLVAAYQCFQRDRLRRAERRIPARPVLHRTHRVAAFVHILPRRLMPDQLLARLWMLALREARELFLAHLSMKPATLPTPAPPPAAPPPAPR